MTTQFEYNSNITQNSEVLSIETISYGFGVSHKSNQVHDEGVIIRNLWTKKNFYQTGKTITTMHWFGMLGVFYYILPTTTAKPSDTSYTRCKVNFHTYSQKPVIRYVSLTTYRNHCITFTEWHTPYCSSMARNTRLEERKDKKVDSVDLRQNFSLFFYVMSRKPQLP